MQRRAFEKLVAMRTPFYEKFRSGDILTRFSTDVEGMMEMAGYGIVILLYAGGMIAFVVPTMFFISWEISLLAMLPLMILMIWIYVLGKKQDKLVENNREAVASLNDEVLETIEGVRVARAYSKKTTQKEQFQLRTKALSKVGDQIAGIQYFYAPLSSVFIALSTIIVLLIGVAFIKTGQLTIGQVIALQLYMISLIEPFWMLSDFILVYQTGKTSFKKVTELIETTDDMEMSGKEELQHLISIRFQDYYFTYPQAENPSLRNIAWQIEAGKTYGIVGKTGSGKTTLVRQLLQQYPIGQGEFQINGKFVGHYSRQSIEAMIGYVPQEHILFSKSVKDNIVFGKRNATLSDIERAIETAAFSEDLKRMPDGLETLIGERGVSISGGQKQRISLARAFIRQPEVLILDDSLSAVDAQTERRIIKNLQDMRANQTTIIVTHRLSAIQQADWVLVLEDGQIVEEGTPNQLLNKGGWYAEQYQRQQHQKGGSE
ncbi:ABC transporter ATP-binding protein [Streptococcus anginosus]|nr:ABC transporter ATP-binding protein [Streptococcus anginosus]